MKILLLNKILWQKEKFQHVLSKRPPGEVNIVVLVLFSAQVWTFFKLYFRCFAIFFYKNCKKKMFDFRKEKKRMHNN